MNANELADMLEEEHYYASAAMLRQQQAEIEALRMMLANRNDALDKLDLK